MMYILLISVAHLVVTPSVVLQVNGQQGNEYQCNSLYGFVYSLCPHCQTESCSSEGDFRQQLTEDNGITIQYCSGGSWHYLCSGGVGWTPTLATVACRQLGYSDQGKEFY